MMRMRRIAALAAAIPLALAAAFVAAKDMQVEAKIKQVNLDDRSITVQIEDTGMTKTFRLADDTEISFDRDIQGGAAARRGNFGDLQANQDVTLRFDDEDMDGQWVIVRFITVS